jgi:hypothetical protein
MPRLGEERRRVHPKPRQPLCRGESDVAPQSQQSDLGAPIEMPRFERVENLLGPLGVVVRVGMEQPAVLVLVLVLVAAVIVVVVVVVFPLG